MKKNEKIAAVKDLVRSLVRTDGEEVFFYLPGENIWQAKCGAKAAMALLKIIENTSTAPSITAAEAKTIVADIQCDPTFFRPLKMPPVALINCRSGIIDLSNLEANPPQEDHDFLLNLDFEYMKTVTLKNCKHFADFLRFAFDFPNDISFDDMLEEPPVCRLLEMLGYMVSNEYRAKKMLLLIGPPNSGKSQLLDLLRRVVGPDQTVALTLDELSGQSGGRFRTELLLKAHALINDELPTRGLKNLSELKKIIAGEMITVEAKGLRPRTIRNTTKLMFAGNQLPELAEVDSGKAFSSRLCVVFLKKAADSERRDIDLLSKLYDERNTIFSLAVNAFSKIATTLEFTGEPVADKALQAYAEENSSVLTFIDDSTVICEGEGIYTVDLHQVYLQYCKERALTPVKSLKSFRQQLLCTPKVQEIRKGRLEGDENPRSIVWVITLVNDCGEDRHEKGTKYNGENSRAAI